MADSAGKRRVQLILLITGVLTAFVVVLVIVIGPWVVKSYDSDHRQSISCEVESADAKKFGSGGRGAATTFGVEIRTSSCGVLILSPGINSDNGSEVAAQLKPGHTYQFDVGSGSLAVKWFTDIFGIALNVYDFSEG